MIFLQIKSKKYFSPPQYTSFEAFYLISLSFCVLKFQKGVILPASWQFWGYYMRPYFKAFNTFSEAHCQ